MQDTFQWTDESVSEFIMERFVRFSSEFMQMHIDEFKSSKSPKKEWEIVAYGEIYEGEKLMYKLQPSGGYRNEDWECDIEYDATQFNNPNEFIHSVRRLSDGEVFSVGDRLKDFSGCITSFEVNSVWAGGLGLRIDEGSADNILDAEKLPSPIFITTDGAEMHDKMDYILVTETFDLVPMIATLTDNWKPNFKTFSTREAAEKYILENKPLLSLNDVKETASATVKNYWLLMEALSIKVKKKLNQ